MKWIDATKKQPDNCYLIAVLLWNQFSDTFESAIGIYDVPTKVWEIKPNINLPVAFWVKLPEEPTKHNIVKQ